MTLPCSFSVQVSISYGFELVTHVPNEFIAHVANYVFYIIFIRIKEERNLLIMCVSKHVLCKCSCRLFRMVSMKVNLLVSHLMIAVSKDII